MDISGYSYSQPMSISYTTNIYNQQISGNINNYQIGHELGRGTFGVTYYGYDTANNREVAIKTIDINKSMQMGADINSINEEINTLKEISGGDCSKYVACFYESFRDVLNGVDTVFIVSEYINGGSLTDFIKNNNGIIPPTALWSLYLQLILGLKFIHDRGYAHRDIKPDNILITEDYTIKYIDFGLACLQRCKITACTNTCRGSPGTLLYMPPEFFNGTREESLDGSKAHDLWSLGVVMFELAHGINMYPFDILTPDKSSLLPNDQLISNIASAPQYSSNYILDDGRTNNFLTDILINNWRLRPTVDMSESILIDNVLSKLWVCK